MGDEEVDPVAEAKAIMNPKKVLIVLTSTTAYPDETATGFWLTELTHPMMRWKAAGWTVEFASPLGCAQPDPASVENATASGERESLDWAELEESKAMLASHAKLEDVAAREELDVDVLFFVGGYGTMWDLPDNEHVKALTAKLFEAGKIVRRHTRCTRATREPPRAAKRAAKRAGEARPRSRSAARAALCACVGRACGARLARTRSRTCCGARASRRVALARGSDAWL